MVVSIIIPAYNSEKFIRRCLDSVVNQIYKNIEIIVVDDASTDNTEKIIKEYAEKDNRIRPFYSSENKGVSFSRNIGLKASTGEYIMFVDSDDELTKDAIRRMVDIANKYNSDYVDSYQIIKYAKNNKEYMFTEFKLPKKHLVLGSIENNPKIINMYMYIKGKLIKKNLINDLLFDESLKIYEDLVFEQTIKSKVRNYVMINKPIYVYYEREDSLVNSLGKKHECYLQASKLVKEIYKNYDINIKNIVESMLFQNGILTLFTKVIKNNDPTAHAEVVAIREACKKLNTYDLSNYILYTSCEPCPMCLSAIIWANIKEVYYGCTKEDAGNIGFRDDIIYDYLKGNNKDLICLKQLDREECLETFKRYSEENGTIY